MARQGWLGLGGGAAGDGGWGAWRWLEHMLEDLRNPLLKNFAQKGERMEFRNAALTNQTGRTQQKY